MNGSLSLSKIAQLGVQKPNKTPNLYPLSHSCLISRESVNPSSNIFKKKHFQAQIF